MELFRAGDVTRILVLGASGALIAAAKLFHVNENMLFLSIVLACCAWVAIAVRPRTAAAFGVVVVLVAFWPVKVPAPVFIDAAVIDYEQRWSAWLPADSAWQYTFTLTNIEQHVAECGPMIGLVYIDGHALTPESVAIDVIGTTLAEPPKFSQANSLDQIQLTPRTDGVRAFTVRLAAKAGHQPAIRIGAEVQRDVVFSDAVFAEFRNANCAVLYHARRDAALDNPRVR